jgi:GxxExxY protein
MELADIARISVDCGYKLHQRLGPGLLESVYELILAESLARRGLSLRRQVGIDISYDDFVIENAFRVDLLVEDKFVIELKSSEKQSAVYKKQVLTYLRLMNLSLGFVMNFGMATFQEGCDRVVNKHTDFASSRLRVSQKDAAAHATGGDVK